MCRTLSLTTTFFVNDSMKNSDDEFVEIYDGLAGSSIDKFMQIETTISKREFDEATAVLNTFVPGELNTVEQSNYDFYTLSVKYKQGDDEFEENDMAALLSIAGACPGTHGSSVFQARALYQLITGRVFNGPDGCSEESGRMALSQNPKKNKSTQSWNVDVFPNPTQNKLNIINTTKNETLEISIFDLTGRIVKQQVLKIHENTGTLHLDLINGVYFITIRNSLNETVTKQIFIAK